MEYRTSTTNIKVRSYHIDSYQHVNNMRYMEFLEEARWTHFEGNKTLETVAKSGVGFVIANYNIDYLYPASMDQTLEIKTSLAKMGKKSVVFKQEIFIKENQKQALSANVTLVSFDIKTQLPAEITEEMRAEIIK
ncbi:acyl-CoA thioesterase [Flammeovirga sp. MY04]|uniref:acyl-CoA thioesterase n=1 Tax=Flammeovirga sp. MY04 TaxID=1191459 RepID=UPI0008063C27|nr:thioesterase family protein [Flammeovirga sp. MY04]ANQ47770.1 acyl-CoA thioesterase [Flammeovirga sp. MY04]